MQTSLKAPQLSGSTDPSTPQALPWSSRRYPTGSLQSLWRKSKMLPVAALAPTFNWFALPPPAQITLAPCFLAIFTVASRLPPSTTITSLMGSSVSSCAASPPGLRLELAVMLSTVLPIISSSFRAQHTTDSLGRDAWCPTLELPHAEDA